MNRSLYSCRAPAGLRSGDRIAAEIQEGWGAAAWGLTGGVGFRILKAE